MELWNGRVLFDLLGDKLLRVYISGNLALAQQY
jgi:hypothetical protein